MSERRGAGVGQNGGARSRADSFKGAQKAKERMT